MDLVAVESGSYAVYIAGTLSILNLGLVPALLLPSHLDLRKRLELLSPSLLHNPVY